MGEKSRKWIDEHRKELEEKYSDKAVIVSGNKVVKVLELTASPFEINKVASEICGDKDWSYTYVWKERAWLI